MATASGGKLDTTAIITLAIFGVLAATAVFLSLRQSTKQKAAMEQFAASHGWRFLGRDQSQLRPVLDQVDPSESWTAADIVLVERPPASVHLFSYSSTRRGRRSYEYGFGCLAEHTGWGSEERVSIYRRVPLLEKMLSDRVEVGEPEFRREYTVACRQPDVAATVVNYAVQKIMLEHASHPQWALQVRIVGQRVLVTTSWAQKPEEWDYLITLTRRLRAAMP